MVNLWGRPWARHELLARVGRLDQVIAYVERDAAGRQPGLEVARRGDIVAAVGPCIAQASYEVDDSFRARFPADCDEFFARGQPGHWQFDLEGYIAGRLERAGVGLPHFRVRRRAAWSGVPGLLSRLGPA